QLTLAPSSVEPGLWSNLAANQVFRAVLHVRDASGHEYLTYNLVDPFITEFEAAENAGNAPTDRITVAITHLFEDYKVLNSDGTVVSENRALGDFVVPFRSLPGSLSAPALAAPPRVGVTFDTGSRRDNEVALQGFSWGMSGGSNPSVQDFQLTLDASSVEPGLWSAALVQRPLQAVIHVRDG